MKHAMSELPAVRLWLYNINLLTQATFMIGRLQTEAIPAFDYARAVGPHIRHVIEHYLSFLGGLGHAPDYRIAYDVRSRNLAMQSQPVITVAKIQELQRHMQAQVDRGGRALDMVASVQTVFQSGENGEMDVAVPSTVGRELLFLSSHTVHHFALIAHYCKLAGVDLGERFGKAPSTVAFEQRQH